MGADMKPVFTQARVRDGGATQGVRGSSRGPGRAQGAGGRRGAPGAHGLEPGGEPAAPGAEVRGQKKGWVGWARGQAQPWAPSPSASCLGFSG